jgi:4-hydroxybenzoyl-CoA reductase subunit beta
MRLPDFSLVRPRTLAEAVEFTANPAARIIAGGTDLLANLARGIESPRVLVSLERLADLKTLELHGEGVRIGAGVSVQRIANDERLPAALREAARAIAAPAHRAAATLGGNLCLDTRCIYYNQGAQWRASNNYCLKRGGDTCHVAPKGKVCRAAFSGDLAPALLALGAEVEIAGRRTVVRPLGALYRDDGARALALEPGEIVTGVRVPIRRLASGYAKARRRGAIDFPLAGVAIAVSLDQGVIRELRVGLTGTNPCPIVLSGTDALVGRKPGEAMAALAKLVQKQVKPLRTTIGAADYRRQVAAVLARRLLARLTDGDGS